jgi:hypothetical protein
MLVLEHRLSRGEGGNVGALGRRKSQTAGESFIHSKVVIGILRFRFSPTSFSTFVNLEDKYISCAHTFFHQLLEHLRLQRCYWLSLAVPVTFYFKPRKMSGERGHIQIMQGSVLDRTATNTNYPQCYLSDNAFQQSGSQESTSRRVHTPYTISSTIIGLRYQPTPSFYPIPIPASQPSPASRRTIQPP